MKLKNDIEEKISSKIHEFIDGLNIEKGQSLLKSVQDSSKKIAKHIVKKLKELQKKDTPKKIKVAASPKKSKPKIEKSDNSSKKISSDKVDTKKVTVHASKILDTSNNIKSAPNSAISSAKKPANKTKAVIKEVAQRPFIKTSSKAKEKKG